MGALDADFALRFERQRRALDARDRAEILQAEYDDREADRRARDAGYCPGCGLRRHHWLGYPRTGTDGRPTLGASS